MCANVTSLPIDTGVKQSERTIFSTLFQWDYNCNCFQMHSWRNHTKFSVFWKSYLTRLSRTNITGTSVISVLLSSDKCWSNLPLKCHIFLISDTHKSYSITCTIILFILWLVCLEPVTTCWYGSIIKRRHYHTSVLLPAQHVLEMS